MTGGEELEFGTKVCIMGISNRKAFISVGAPPGSGSCFRTLSLAYASRRLAIDTRRSDIAKPTNDKDMGAGTFDLARGEFIPELEGTCDE